MTIVSVKEPTPGANTRALPAASIIRQFDTISGIFLGNCQPLAVGIG